MQVLCDALEHVQSHALEAVLPIFRAIAGDAEALVLHMHDADWSTVAPGDVAQPSSYVRRLADVCRRFRADFLAHFVPQPSPSVPSLASLLCQRFAGRLLAFFVRHAAMLKPLAQPGKLQLAKVRAFPLLALRPGNSRSSRWDVLSQCSHHPLGHAKSPCISISHPVTADPDNSTS